MFHSHIQYCNTILWGNAAERILQSIERLEDKTIKIMCFVPFGQNDVGHFYSELGMLRFKNMQSKVHFRIQE